MIYPPDHILVLGHRNPDTDASVSAVGYAAFLQQAKIYPAPVVAGIPGPAPPQSQYVFDRAGISPPPIVESLLPRVCDVAQRQVDSISTRTRFRDAVEMLIRTEHSMLPILDENRHLFGVFSHRRDVSRFLFDFDVIPLLSRLLTWNDILEMPGARPGGKQPQDCELRGRVCLAVEGEGDWRRTLEPDDLLVCGDVTVLRGLNASNWPRWIVLTSQTGDLPAAEIANLNQRGTAVVLYRHAALDFLFALMSQVRVGALNLDSGPCVGEFDFLHDIQGVIAESRHALPVLSSENMVVGTISQRDVLAPPRRRIILIDHFESGQTVSGCEHAEILEIVDHHRVGDIQTASPARVDCRPLGSSSTIVALRHLEAGMAIERPVAMILLGGVMSDTLCLTSPTTTVSDREVARKLGIVAGVDPHEFGMDVLRAGDDLLTADPAKIWNRDQKSFSIRNRSFAVAQLETTSIETLDPAVLAVFGRLLQEDFARGEHLLSALFVTDVLKGDSWVMATESPAARGIIARCFGATEPRPGWVLARGIISRKKQIVPALLRLLSELRI